MNDTTAKNNRFAGAFADIVSGLSMYPVWSLLASQSIRQRYRRSTLGPLWMTISMAVQMATMGFLVTFLFSHSFQRFLPYLCLGIIFWSFYSTLLNEGAGTFLTYTTYIKAIKRPFTLYIAAMIYKSVLESAHHLVIYVIIAAVFLVVPGKNTLWLLFTIPLALLNVGWSTLFLAIVSTRFRDVPMIIQSSLTVVFWLTPIIYFPEQLGDKRILVDINPIAHMIDILRLPILNQPPTNLNLWVAIGMAIGGWYVTMKMFSRYRTRLTLWL
jgi:lipopolysaccharide transport system permease protein